MIKIIAEIGWNHMGDVDLAEKMIKSCSENGADYAKFQTWSVKRLKDGEWDSDGRRQIYESAELTVKKHKRLIEVCKQNNVKFLSSVFSVEDAILLRELSVKEVKIPSFECRNHELIEYCNQNFDRIFMSTGTSIWEEVQESVSLIDKAELVLMHCVSAYPSLPENANIKKINNLKDICENVGYSDHIQGVESAKVAIGLGACVIEKHFTIDQTLPGRDNKFAILPEQLKDLSDYITLLESMCKWHGLNFQECERSSREQYAGRFNDQER